MRGHAFEARVYAEDPDNDFLPVTGTLAYLQPPEESRHVRVDTGVRQGDEISVYYDPMIAKLIVWDESRERALQRLATALADYRIGGTVTNLDFLYNLATCTALCRRRTGSPVSSKTQRTDFPRATRVTWSASSRWQALAAAAAQQQQPAHCPVLIPGHPGTQKPPGA